jgi:hypothetical protein
MMLFVGWVPLPTLHYVKKLLTKCKQGAIIKPVKSQKEVLPCMKQGLGSCKS